MTLCKVCNQEIQEEICPVCLLRVRTYIKSVPWKFAKTMAKIPHSYTVKAWSPQLRGEMVIFAKLIAAYGYDEPFFKKSYRYLEIDDYKYWSMWPIPEEVILINRAKL